MRWFKSDTDRQIDRVRELLTSIARSYEALSQPLKALRRQKRLSSEQKEALDDLKRFQFYPRLGHVENQFFEKEQAASYRLQRAAQLGAIGHSKKLPPRVVSVKGKSVRFAERIGLPVPRTDYPLKLNEIALDKPCVIKPLYVESSDCLFALEPAADGSFREHFSGRQYESRQALMAAIDRSAKKAGVSDDAWIREEMIVGSGGSPRETFDVKVYCFYGRAGLVLQVDRWRGRQYRFFNPKGKLVDAGKYATESLVSARFDRALIRAAERASARIPWPHVRVDFLVSDTDWRFGEFTLRPGVPAAFNETWDRKLGQLYVKAQARLMEDLILGKDFSEYRDLLPEGNRASKAE